MITKNKIKSFHLLMLQFLAGVALSILFTMACLWLYCLGFEISFSYRFLLLLSGVMTATAGLMVPGFVVAAVLSAKLGLGKAAVTPGVFILIAVVLVVRFIPAINAVAAKYGLGLPQVLLLGICFAVPYIAFAWMTSRFTARHPLPVSKYCEDISEEDDLDVSAK